MESLAAFSPVFMAGAFLTGFGIFFIGFLALLLTGFNALLNAKIEPLKDNQVRMEKRMDGFEKRLDGIDSKLDQLIAAKSA